MAASIDGSSNWQQLRDSITALSRATTWRAAIKEWELMHIELLDNGEYQSCLCGKTPIVELCHIRNVKNGNEATVGNICIKKFTSDRETENASLASVPTIIDACKRILKNPKTASANEALIQYAYDQGLFSENDTEFYMDIKRKRDLSTAQANYKKSLNQKLLYEVILSTQKAFTRLKSNSANTAGPKLINFAFEKGVLSAKDKNFYLQIWNRKPLSPRQEQWRMSLNNRMLQALPAYFNQAPDRPGRPGRPGHLGHLDRPGGHGAGAGAAHPAEPVAASYSPPLKRRRVQLEAPPRSTEGSQASAAAAASAASSD